MITHLPVETMVNEVLSLASVNGLWNTDIIDNCDSEISKECKSLYLENFIKLYIKIRCFSFAKILLINTNLAQMHLRRKLCEKN